jgi:phosphoribosylaminoimidazole-succinocarboxamide synthase
MALLSFPLSQLDSQVHGRRAGKVREVIDLGDAFLIVSSDRLSAFDVVMPNGIPDKGKVLNQMSAYWFDLLKGVVRNHMIATDDATIAGRLGQEVPELKGRTTLAKKANPLPIECVVRGYLAGSFTREYRQAVEGGSVTLHGVTLPSGLEDGSPLSEPVFTPATKAESGHDENISFDRAADLVGREVAEEARRVSLELYRLANLHAAQSGLILADTKFEFGLDDDGLLWIDEALTPDSSRYWEVATWAPGGPQPSFDKQFVRDWLETTGWDKTPPGPEIPDDIVAKTRAKYVEAFERVTGQTFQP